MATNILVHLRSRRARWLAPLLALGLVAAVPVATSAHSGPGTHDDTPLSIWEENQLPGSKGWNITRRGSDAGMEIEGFMSASSVDLGDSIDYHLSVSEPQDITIEVYRMGWYQGQGGRLVTTIGPVAGQTKADPVVDPATGRITTDWSADHRLDIPENWTSGVYLSRLIRADGYDAHTIFVVRDDRQRADFIVQLPFTTYQAYNGFPADGTTGKSLYDYNSYGPDPTDGDGDRRAIEVSFDRPYEKDGNGQYFRWDHAVVSFMEREGYNVKYVTSLDVQEQPRVRTGLDGFISSGHDEYWTTEMYDYIEGLRDRGINLAFFGANAAYWRVELKPSTLDGTPNRVMASAKDHDTDLWRTSGRPEQGLVGIQYISPFSSDYQPLVVINSDHWLWAGTGLNDGDTIDAMVGYEIDTFFSDQPSPPGEQVLLAESPFQGNLHNTSVYEAPSGATVFASGTINWNTGLGHPWYSSLDREAIRQATRNVLAHFSGNDDNLLCRGEQITVRLSRGQRPTAGDDVIVGTSGPDTIDGLAGNDVMCGLDGDDTITGGEGNDIIDGDRGEDIIDGGNGDDKLYGGRNNDTLIGGEGDDLLRGNGGSDDCDGGPGRNKIRKC